MYAVPKIRLIMKLLFDIPWKQQCLFTELADQGQIKVQKSILFIFLSVESIINLISDKGWIHSINLKQELSLYLAISHMKTLSN